MQIELTASLNMSKSAGIFIKIYPQLISELWDYNFLLNVAILQSPLKRLPWESRLAYDMIFGLFFKTRTPVVQCLKLHCIL